VISDAKGIYSPEPNTSTAAYSPRQMPVWNWVLLAVPIMVALLLCQFIGIQGAASLLWIYPILPLLPLAEKMAGYPSKFWGTLLLAVLIQLFYGASKIISHSMFAPDLSDATLSVTPLYLGVILLTIVLLCYGALDKKQKRPTAFENWLYVRLLNQRTVFKHRSRAALYD
jgi:hypothetical protein